MFGKNYCGDPGWGSSPPAGFGTAPKGFVFEFKQKAPFTVFDFDFCPKGIMFRKIVYRFFFETLQSMGNEMRLKSIHIQNYRQLKDVHIDLDESTTIFVGANNSGKTSATNLIIQFLGNERFELYDFHAQSWSEFNRIGEQKLNEQSVDLKAFPYITMDLWLTVENTPIHRIVDLLPSLDWNEACIGIRLRLEPKNPIDLLQDFAEAQISLPMNGSPTQNMPENGDSGSPTQTFHPWPKDLCDYLRKKLSDSYAIHYYVLDPKKFDSYRCVDAGYVPEKLGEGTGQKCRNIINSLIRIDALNAQRHLTDSNPSSRSESLSNRFSNYYKSRSKKENEDIKTMHALHDSEQRMNDLFKEVFAPFLDAIKIMGYPGFASPQLQIRSSINPEKLLLEDANVQYILDGSENNISLPDRYNGLGYKNLIYMIIELMDYSNRFPSDQEMPLLHLIIIEEPEAHLHVQLQQVFIRQVIELLKMDSSEKGFTSQLIVTTHSPHIIYEKGFPPIRYFRRKKMLSNSAITIVLNLSEFNMNEAEQENNKFLMQYMKLTHCDLFFADAAIFVEGNVERLLLPLMIKKAAKKLQTNYLSIIEVGGAFAHKFRNLINFLGITTLVITDLDSVTNAAPNNSCPTGEPNAITSNPTLKNWLPEIKLIKDFLDADHTKKILHGTGENGATIRVAYQTRQNVVWNGITTQLAGRTLEDMFALENLDWCQNELQQDLKLRIKKADTKNTSSDILQILFNHVKSGNFNKTEFSLNLIMKKIEDWNVPHYIAEGLGWLEHELENSHINEQTKSFTEGKI
ncbi:MAG: pathosis related protein [Magnetococcales bacterium]|nr:pathosis related protein [Magnetococcales bacterium]